MSKSKGKKTAGKRLVSLSTVSFGVGMVGLTTILSVGYVAYGDYLRRLGLAAKESRQVFKVAERAGVASLALVPEKNTVGLGDTFEVQVLIDSSGREVIGVDAAVVFDKEVLEVLEVKQGTGFDRYFQEIVSMGGELYIGSISNPGKTFQGAGIWVTIVFKAVGVGEATVDIIDDSGIAEVKTGRDILRSMEGAVYTVVSN